MGKGDIAWAKGIVHGSDTLSNHKPGAGGRNWRRVQCMGQILVCLVPGMGVTGAAAAKSGTLFLAITLRDISLGIWVADRTTGALFVTVAGLHCPPGGHGGGICQRCPERWR
jgi:hypothetical protein